MISGEVTTTAVFNPTDIARNVIKRIGYTSDEMGFDYKTCAVITAMGKQSPDISMGVSEGQGLHKEQGAGDQGLMFGYACDETSELMPASISYSHKLCKRLAEVRKEGTLGFLRPDGKAQVTVQYENGSLKRVETVVVSTQHSPDVAHNELTEAVMEEIVKKTIPAKLLDSKTKYFINPTGRFVVGGPMGDCGLTGRKIIVDTYGGSARHGGGAFSGKDATKVDRSAAYAARQLAKDVVSRGWADSCEVQVAYAIGEARPVSFAFLPTGDAKGHEIAKWYQLEGIDLYGLFEPAQIIERLQLRLPSYLRTAAFGHFGRDDVSWEMPLDRSQQERDHVRELAIREQVGRMGVVSGLALDQVKAKRAEDYAEARAEFMASHI